LLSQSRYVDVVVNVVVDVVLRLILSRFASTIVFVKSTSLFKII